MLNDENYETILNRVLSKVPEYIDVRPSSPIYMAIAPVVWEIYQYNMNLHWVMDQIFPKTQNFENLKKNAEQYGIEPKYATKALILGKFDKELPENTRFRLEGTDLIYVSQDRMEIVSDPYNYSLLCETFGSGGNMASGRLIPVTSVPGLKSAQCVELLKPARDDETHEEFLNRFLTVLGKEPFGWNEAQYIQQINGLPGVSQCRVVHKIPQTETDYNVIVHLLGIGDIPATDTLIEEVSNYLIKSVPYTHNPQVIKASVDSINVSASLTISTGAEPTAVETAAKNTIKKIVKDVVSGWGQSKTPLVLRVSTLTAALYNVPGVVDVSDVKINNQASNFTATAHNIISVNTITITI